MPHSPIEYTVLYALAEDVADHDPEIMLELIDIFVNDSTDHLRKMSTEIESQEFRTLEISAHSLKSSSATFGALALSELSGQIERMARSKTPNGIAPLLESARAEFKLVAAVLATERKRWVEATEE